MGNVGGDSTGKTESPLSYGGKDFEDIKDVVEQAKSLADELMGPLANMGKEGHAKGSDNAAFEKEYGFPPVTPMAAMKLVTASLDVPGDTDEEVLENTVERIKGMSVAELRHNLYWTAATADGMKSMSMAMMTELMRRKHLGIL
jgi:hypothetical protein